MLIYARGKEVPAIATQLKDSRLAWYVPQVMHAATEYVPHQASDMPVPLSGWKDSDYIRLEHCHISRALGAHHVHAVVEDNRPQLLPADYTQILIILVLFLGCLQGTC